MNVHSEYDSLSSSDSAGSLVPILSIVVPVYRSEDSLCKLLETIRDSLSDRPELSYEVILVNDGSPDGSWDKICTLLNSGHPVVGINLRKNFGQDNAIMTGIRFARGRFLAIMDDDLQHDPNDIPRLIDKLQEGHDVVYANFRRKHQALWKNLGSWLNGKLAEWVIGKPPNVYLSPYKAFRREIAQLITRYEGPDPYVDGLLFQVTSRISEIDAEHHPRYIGSGSFTLRRSIRVGLRLALSFSVLPLRVVTIFGAACCIFGSVLAVWLVAWRLISPNSFPPEALGWASLMLVSLISGGAQLGCLGIVGEYVGRVFLAINRAPQATVANVIGRKLHARDDRCQVV